MKVNAQMPTSAAVAQAIVDHVNLVRVGKARNKQLTYGQPRDWVQASTGLNYEVFGSGTYLGHVLDSLVMIGLPVALTTFNVPTGKSLEIEMFEPLGITRRILVEKKQEVLDFDWSSIKFVAELNRPCRSGPVNLREAIPRGAGSETNATQSS